MFNLLQLENNYPNHLWLRISNSLKEKAWMYSQNHSKPDSKSNAYLNYLAIHLLKDWLSDWFEEDLLEKPDDDSSIRIRIFKDLFLSSIWEFINGTIINVEKVRFALIPTETTATDELCVPQEWVDISGWKADYYLAIQLNFDNWDESWMRVWGFISYEDLKNQGVYEEQDRAYYIDEGYLTDNFPLMLEDLEIMKEEKLEFKEVWNLSQEPIPQLTSKLDDYYSPRLALPFENWKELFVNDNKRVILYQSYNKEKVLQNKFNLVNRSIKVTNRSMKVMSRSIIKLNQWLNGNFERGWEKNQLAFRGERESLEKPLVIITAKKYFELEKAEQQLTLLVGLQPKEEEKTFIMVEAYPQNDQSYLPDELQLIMLDEDEEVFMQAQARNAKKIYLDFVGESGDCFKIKIVIGNDAIIESFLI